MLKVATVCTGIGAPEKALQMLGIPYELAFFSEIDKAAIRSYCAIHKEDESKNFGDLKNVETVPLPNDIDLIIGGTPCQDFSLAGKGAGGEEGSGTRSSLMWYYIKLISMYKPKVVIWENVAGVLAYTHLRNYHKFTHTLNALGYDLNAKLVNAKYFNIPQNRVRIFVVATRKDLKKEYEFPYGYDSGIRIKHILQDKVADKYFTKRVEKTEMYPEPYYLEDTHRIMKVGCLHNNNYRQDNNILSIQGISECLMAQQDRSKGPKIYDTRFDGKRIRRFTERESFRLMGFTDEDYFRSRYRYVKQGKKKIPETYVSESDIYKQAGNSIVVHVMAALIGELYGIDWKPIVFGDRYKTDEQLLMEMPLFRGLVDYEDTE